MQVYTTGFEVFVTARFRPGIREDRSAARKSFRLGMQLADGTKVVSPSAAAGPTSTPSRPAPS